MRYSVSTVLNLAACMLVTCVAGQSQTSPTAPPTSPNLISSISYGQGATGSTSSMDIHVALLQPADAGFPCSAGATATVDPLILTNADVKSVDGTTAHINKDDLQPASETGGYVFHVPVGINLDLPSTWDSFTFVVQAHCTNSAQTQQSPRMTIRRFAATDPLQISILNGQQQWIRSDGHDTLSFVIKASRAVSIQSLIIRDTQPPANVITQPFNDPVDSTTHNITLVALDKFSGSHQYSYEISLTAGGIPITPAAGLPMFATPPAPTQDYALLHPPSPNDLIIRDASNDFSFNAIATDSGSLDIQFDSLTIQGSNTVHSTVASDNVTHTFKIAKADIPSDGQYSFHFVGTRGVQPPNLNGLYESTLIVSTKTTLSGPVGLSLKNGSIVVSYCLSQKSATSVKIAPASNPSSYYVGADGQSSVTVGCTGTSSGYTASVPLTDFSAKVNASASAGGGAAQPVAGPAGGAGQPAAGVANPGSANVGSTTVPIELFIMTSPGANVLATLNLDAVLLNSQSQSGTAITSALSTITNKNSSSDQKTAATKTLQTAGLSTDTISSLSKLGKNSSSVTSAIGTILGTVGKSFVSAYLGIPAPSAASTPAPAPQPAGQ